MEGKSYVRHGVFIEGVELFGNDLFGIVPGEAAVMAPEQRHLLEVVFMTALGARWERAEMGCSPTGCFIGQEPSDWKGVVSSGSPYSATGGALSISSNRVSFVFGLQGGSMTIDTACSASLVALDSGA